MHKIELVHWESEYSVGAAEIDSQHKDLVELINELISHSAQSQSGWKKKFEKSIKSIAAHSSLHFKTEEEILSKTEYKNFADHKKEHERLTGKLKHIINELDNIKWEVELYTLTVSFKEWFLSHILLYDKEAKDYFKARAG